MNEVTNVEKPITQRLALRYFDKIACPVISKAKMMKAEAGISLGIGKMFSMETLVLQDGQIRKKKIQMPEYLLRIYGNISIRSFSSKNSLYLDTIDSCKIISELDNQRILSVHLSESNQISLILQDYQIDGVESKEINWSIKQPKTQEKQIYAGSNGIFVTSFYPKRWSSNHPRNRDKWHDMEDIYAITLDEEAKVRTDFSSSIRSISEMVGTRLSFVRKSPDINVLECFFEHDSKSSADDITLHITCGVKIKLSGGSSYVLYGDSPLNKYIRLFNQLEGQKVTAVELQENHVLALSFEDQELVIFPSGDEKASWRYISADKCLAASNVELWLE